MTTLPNTTNLAFVEALFEDYLQDPESVPQHWRRFFRREMGSFQGTIRPTFTPSTLFDPPALQSAPTLSYPTNPTEIDLSKNGGGVKHPPLGSIRPNAPSMDIAIRQDRVDQLIRAYRVRGHMIANVDPLGMPRPDHPELDPGYYHLTEADFDCTFSSRTIFGTETLTLRQILKRLRNTYCRSIGVEFMHIHDVDSKNWLQERMEGSQNRLEISTERQRHIYTLLTDATILEEFIQKKFLGAKSFSLEGSESLIPLLDWAIERASGHGVDEVTLGMAHRGRLNVLANILRKSPSLIFREFDDKDAQLYRGRGDVKYHLGYSSDITTLKGRNVHLSLCFNPSHLEYVNTVVQGRVRAKQDRVKDKGREKKLAILIHGDAAFAGEGIVQETLNLSGLDAYHVGGTLHVIVNNQIGFTTSPHQSRTSTYCTDVAKMLQIPIFHVNGEDPEAVAQVVNMALDFRARFKRDVIIDMYGYRRHGHNETDEPAFTQPLMYKAIARRPSVRESYLTHLLQLGGFTREEADRIALERREMLDRELNVARQADFHAQPQFLGGYWQGYFGGRSAQAERVDTSIASSELTRLLDLTCRVPEGFQLHKKVERLFAQRHEMAEGQRVWDWGAAEMAAFASVIDRGVPVRMSGQDVERGTFSHRHAVVHDNATGATHCSLRFLASKQGLVEIYNSALSESGVLGFEWGYSLDCPEGLVLWEAQFGDFCNVAQVIIDQFISSAEDKWNRLSGLVLLLPHGFEGMGPEHSSARLERFLTLAAEDNMQIVQPTTPAQMFHLLRRQVMRKWRKPLIVFSPKSLLRHPRATNTLEEVARGRFEAVLRDETVRPEHVRRVLLCSGKIYYELEKHREDLERKDVAILRVEELYPFPDAALGELMAEFPADVEVFWVQDEPYNQGAWPFLRLVFGDRLLGKYAMRAVTRERSASPATGSASSHKLEQRELLDAAFAELSQA